jgi:hypothetical protein
MSNTILAEKDAKTRHDALAECELKIARASTDTVESIRIIGKELLKIEKEQLFEVMGKNDFREYVEHCLRIDYGLARSWMRASPVLEALKGQKLQLPYSQSQVIELIKIKDTETMMGLWRRILDYCDKEQVSASYDMVRGAVEKERTKTGERLTRARKPSAPAPGITIDLGETQQPNGAVVRESVWSEEGEKALNRIRRFCGDPIADAVNVGNPKILERDLIAWSQAEPDMIKNLSYWIVIKRWTYRKAVLFEETAFNMSTTVETLRDVAKSRGGRAYAEIEDVKITVEVEP